jgi:2-dehydro-3-deoxy-D-arabinonate dehydratase
MAFIRVQTDDVNIRWAHEGNDGIWVLPQNIGLAELLASNADELSRMCEGAMKIDDLGVRRLAPVDPATEVWAAGVTYERSVQARREESTEPDIYDRVYDAQRPELFFKSAGWRARGSGQSISVRSDSVWNVPEPELAAVLRADQSIFGWTICNDVSSRSIEGENPLYLPQAKVYLGGCALGPGIVPAEDISDPYDLDIRLAVEREGTVIWSGESSTSLLRRRVDELARYLFAADIFPYGVVLSTGTCLVPDNGFTLSIGDLVRISIDGIGELTNPVVPMFSDHDLMGAGGLA